MAMSFVMANYLATFVVLLITYETIFLVKGQCTVPGCDYKDSSISIVTEIQQLKDELFDQFSKQVQSLHEILRESLQEMKTDIVNTSLQVFNRRLQDQDICVKNVQSIHELLNESFQEMKSQHDTVITNLQSVNQQHIQEHAVYIKQSQSIHELLNESFQEMRSQHGDLRINLQSNNQQRALEHDVYIKQGQSVHELLNETFQEIKSHHNAVMTSLREVDQRLQVHDGSMKDTNHDTRKIAKDICGTASDVCDCSYIKASGRTTSGVYQVCAGNQVAKICTSAFCDMTTTIGASLVFQRRKDGSVNFNRTWAGYERGFGNLQGEFWLGNEMLNLLTSRRNYKLRVDLEDFHGNKSFAEYSSFSISSAARNYTLTVGGYSGNAGDSLAYHNGRQFSTNDVDNDGYGGNNCAQQAGGGWWFGGCYYSSLNGLYSRQYSTSAHPIGIQWYHLRSAHYSLKAAEMRLVPVA